MSCQLSNVRANIEQLVYFINRAAITLILGRNTAERAAKQNKDAIESESLPLCLVNNTHKKSFR